MIKTKNIPRASTTGSFFTIAFFFAILITPRANVTVTTIGKPSGMAATAKLKNQNIIVDFSTFEYQPETISLIIGSKTDHQ